MRVNDERVSNCARCHRSDWSRRFPFSESDPHRAHQAWDARRAELNAPFSDWLSRNAQSTQDKFPERNAQSIQVKIPERITPPPSRRPKMERERPVERVRDRKPIESNAVQGTNNRVKKRLLAYGGLVIGILACFAIGAEVAGGDRIQAASAKPTSLPIATTSPSVESSASPSPSQKPASTELVSDYQHWSLAKAVADARKRQVGAVTYTDLSDLNRSPSHLGNWKVCSQWPDAGAKSTGTVTFSVLKTNEACASPPRPHPHHDTSSKGSTDSSSGGSTSTADSSPASGSSTTTQLCDIRSNAGNCYHAGEFCRNLDVGETTTDAAGREITCDYEAGANRWHY
jgi:hypothetical protein